MRSASCRCVQPRGHEGARSRARARTVQVLKDVVEILATVVIGVVHPEQAVAEAVVEVLARQAPRIRVGLADSASDDRGEHEIRAHKPRHVGDELSLRIFGKCVRRPLVT